MVHKTLRAVILKPYEKKMGIFSGFHEVALPSTASKLNWNLEMLVFVEGGNPEKNPRSRDEKQQQTQPTLMFFSCANFQCSQKHHCYELS